MPAKRRTNDKLTDAEKELLDIAVRLYTAMQYLEANGDKVKGEWYVEAIGEELVRAPLSYATEATYLTLQDSIEAICSRGGPPRLHPIIELIGEEWGRALDTGTPVDFNYFSIDNVNKRCTSGEAEHPTWNPKLNAKNLHLLLGLQNLDVRHRWWLPGTSDPHEMEDEEDEPEEEPEQEQEPEQEPEPEQEQEPEPEQEPEQEEEQEQEEHEDPGAWHICAPYACG